ncbi:hypothetical protein EDB86DRAFT_1464069 [Lactarius hatsudake]|nr:hypothetical protein EDB86DRAFT_1464069 [Lactarius hatsudake]
MYSHGTLDPTQNISLVSIPSRWHDSCAISCPNRRRTLISPFYTTLRRSSFHPFPGMGIPSNSLNIVKLLLYLAFALLLRSEKFEQPEDVKYSIAYLRYLRRLPLDSFDLSKHTVTTLLIRTLGVQVHLEAGDGTQDVNEMTDLCHGFLGPNISADFPVAAFRPLGDAVMIEFSRGRSVQPESLNKVIECLRD